MMRGRALFGDWLARSVANRITVAAASITAVVVLLLGCVAYGFAQYALLRQAETQLRAQAQLVAQRLSLLLGAVMRDIDGLAGGTLVANALLDTAGRETYLQPFLRDHQLPADVPFALTLIDHRGAPLVSNQHGVAPDYRQAPWLRGMVDGVRPMFVFTAERLLIAVPVLFPATQSVEGGLVLEVGLDELFAEAAAQAPHVARRLMLDDAALLHFDAEGAQVIPAQPLPASARAALIAREPVALTGHLSDARLAVALKRNDEAVIALLGGLAPTLALIGAGVLLFIVWAARLAAHRLTAPLTQLSSTAETISTDGRLDHRVPSLGRDELGVLSSALNRMLDRLRSAHDGLEQQVGERTAALAQARQRLAVIVDQMHDGLVMLDDDGQVESMNRAAETLFDARVDEIEGLHMSRLITGWFKAMHAPSTGGRSRFMLHELIARRGADASFIADCAVTRIEADGAIQWSVLVRDVTERRRAEDALRLANEQLTSSVAALKRRDAQMAQINRMNDMLQSCQSLDEAYEIVERTMAALFPAGSGALAVVGPAGDQLVTVARWGAPVSEPSFHAADCWALRLGRTHRLDGDAHAVACPHHAAAMRAPGLCLPLAVAGQSFGVITAAFDTTDAGASTPVLAVAAESIRAALANLKLRDALREQALRDRLTGLYNRRYLDDALPRELQRARRSSRPLTVVMLDLDHFKRFNDDYGHDAGDHVLREIAGLLRARLRASDIVCRYGGEELTVVMPDTPLADARERLDDIRQQVAALRLTLGATVLPPVTVSMGATQAPDGGGDASALIRAADRALYAAKAAGRNRVVLAAGHAHDPQPA
jgi:diguanylate cyclase (GGDEF)-like protein/PAS domain S-box-containing protein